ncbi:MAG: hypothetical protein ACRCZI_03285 [Cetobacterium sp.]
MSPVIEKSMQKPNIVKPQHEVELDQHLQIWINTFIAGNESKVQERESKVQVFESKVQERESKVQVFESKVQERESKVQERESKVQERESKVQERESKVQVFESKVLVTETRLKEIEFKIKDCIQNQEYKTQQHESVLRDKEEALQNREIDVKSKEEALQTLSSVLKDREEVLQTHEVNVKNKEEALHTLSLVLKERERLLKESEDLYDTNSVHSDNKSLEIQRIDPFYESLQSRLNLKGPIVLAEYYSNTKNLNRVITHYYKQKKEVLTKKAEKSKYGTFSDDLALVDDILNVAAKLFHVRDESDDGFDELFVKLGTDNFDFALVTFVEITTRSQRTNVFYKWFTANSYGESAIDDYINIVRIAYAYVEKAYDM